MSKDISEKQSTTSPLEKLFKAFKGNPDDFKIVINWGGPVGNEVW